MELADCISTHSTFDFPMQTAINLKNGLYWDGNRFNAIPDSMKINEEQTFIHLYQTSSHTAILIGLNALIKQELITYWSQYQLRLESNHSVMIQHSASTHHYCWWAVPKRSEGHWQGQCLWWQQLYHYSDSTPAGSPWFCTDKTTTS